MTRRPQTWLPALLLLASLGLALRQDLAHLAVRQGHGSLGRGDVPGAAAAFARAGALGQPAAPLAFNLGVTLYRAGDYPRARDQFTTALASADPALAAASHYNRGNSQFRLGERLAAGDREAARRLFQAAIADYGQAGTADARANLGLVRARLAVLGGESAQGGERRPAATAQAQPAGDGIGKDAKAMPAAGQAAAAHTAREAEHADAKASLGKTRPALSRQEAERLLNEARGRERPAGPLHAGSQNGPLAKPERDW